MKLAADCLEKFGSVDIDAPIGFAYYIIKEKLAQVLNHIYRNYLDSLSLTVFNKSLSQY
jgi:hypothetical protein